MLISIKELEGRRNGLLYNYKQVSNRWADTLKKNIDLEKENDKLIKTSKQMKQMIHNLAYKNKKLKH